MNTLDPKPSSFTPYYPLPSNCCKTSNSSRRVFNTWILFKMDAKKITIMQTRSRVEGFRNNRPPCLLHSSLLKPPPRHSSYIALGIPSRWILGRSSPCWCFKESGQESHGYHHHLALRFGSRVLGLGFGVPGLGQEWGSGSLQCYLYHLITL